MGISEEVRKSEDDGKSNNSAEAKSSAAARCRIFAVHYRHNLFAFVYYTFSNFFFPPKLKVHTDTIYGNLLYSGREVSRATMAYKYERIDLEEAAKTLSKKQLNLKLIASPDFKPSIAQLIGYNLTNINVMEAWKGPASLELFAHANAPVAALPVRRVLGGTHILAGKILLFISLY